MGITKKLLILKFKINCEYKISYRKFRRFCIQFFVINDDINHASKPRSKRYLSSSNIGLVILFT